MAVGSNKLCNYRTKLRRLECPEVSVNALTNKPDDRYSPAYGVKNPKKAEVNYCPAYPAGETKETPETMRMAYNVQDLCLQEIVQDAPIIADFKTRLARPLKYNISLS